MKNSFNIDYKKDYTQGKLNLNYILSIYFLYKCI